AGFYPASTLIVTVAPTIVGTVLGVVIIDNHQYVLSRDAEGHLYRYPYYGPYHQVYYRPVYHRYDGIYVQNGAYRSAPVRQRDRHRDTGKRTLAPTFQRPHPPPPHQGPISGYQPSQPQHPAYQQPLEQSNRDQRHPVSQQPQEQSNRGHNGGRGNSGGS